VSTAPPAEVDLEISPRARFDVIDVNERIEERHGDLLQQYPRILYFSYHTTAGYLEQSLSSRLNGGKEGLQPYMQVFQTLFPEGADYRHDQIHLRDELSAEQKVDEPRNADSHLAFIGAGLRTCVTYKNRPGEPVYFIDLDGMNAGKPRRRLTSVVGYHHEEVVARTSLEVPVSGHPVDSINLKDPATGLYAHINELARRHGVGHGRVVVSLAAHERQAGLTVNEYETLLMTHDLAEVLRDPLRFMAEKGRSMLADPRAIPHRSIEYAKYDLVRVINRLMERLGMSESIAESLLARMLAVGADRFLRMKRKVSLLVADRDGGGPGAIVQGSYQSPILVQWAKSAHHARRLDITLTRFA